jgi:DNA-binding NarL/FixJ family response regulator
MIRVLVADDQNVLRQALELYLGHEKDIEVIGTANNGAEALEKIELLDPDVAIIDMEMPEMDGLTTTKFICQRFFNTKVLILSSHEEEDYVYSALQAGARGYVLKTTSAKELGNVVRFVYQGYFQLGPGLSEKLLENINTTNPNFNNVAATNKNDFDALVKTDIEIKKLLDLEMAKIREELSLDYNEEINKIKQDLEEGLIIFQKKVSQQIKDGLGNLTYQMNKYGMNENALEEQKVLRFQFVRLRESYEQLQRQFFLLRNILFFTVLAGIVVLLISLFFIR